MASFGNSFADAFEKSYKTSSDVTTDLLKEKIKKQEEKALTEAKILKAQQDYDNLRTFISKKNPQLASDLGQLDVTDMSPDTLTTINKIMAKQVVPELATTKSPVKGFVVDTATAGVTPIINPETGKPEFAPGTRLLQAPMTPETVAARTAASEGAKFDAPIQSEARASSLRKEFQAIPVVKDFQVIREQVGVMDDLINSIKIDDNTKDSNALALDQSLITTFNKITDPTSVVRESEYERTPANLSLANRFSGAFEKLKKGGAGLTKKDREALVFGAKVIADSRGSRYNEILSSYKTIADASGVEPKLVTEGFGEYKPYGAISNKSEKEPQYEYRMVNGKQQRRLISNAK